MHLPYSQFLIPPPQHKWHMLWCPAPFHAKQTTKSSCSTQKKTPPTMQNSMATTCLADATTTAREWQPAPWQQHHYNRWPTHRLGHKQWHQHKMKSNRLGTTVHKTNQVLALRNADATRHTAWARPSIGHSKSSTKPHGTSALLPITPCGFSTITQCLSWSHMTQVPTATTSVRGIALKQAFPSYDNQHTRLGWPMEEQARQTRHPTTVPQTFSAGTAGRHLPGLPDIINECG